MRLHIRLTQVNQRTSAALTGLAGWHNVLQCHAAKIADRVAPAVEEQWHHENVVFGEDGESGIEIGQKAIRVSLKGLFR